ncbi:hypothetical protein GCM10010468_06910 [Actinocorallia longicatena]|uniref:Glycosyltransferase RgtA/B/C/D-like domain-containing protein n=2 Tax=Actinocorallia longicatena TaxID=111803 RepID=A0ABP6PZV1_9ACTN
MAWWPYLLVGGLLGQFLLRLLLSAGRTVPTMIPDETGYLLAGRLLSGGAAGDLSGRTFYQAGYGLFIAPVTWFTSEPDAVYRSVIGINALLGGVLFLLMFGLMRRMGLARWPAYGMAHAGALLPGMVYWSQFALSDTLLTVVVTGWLLAAHSWLRSGRAGYGVAAGLAAAYASAVHSRGAAVFAVHMALVSLVLWRRRPALGRWGAAALAPLAAAAAGRLLNHWVEGKIYPAGAYSFLGFVGDRLTSLSGYAWTGSLVAGKLWYLSVSGWGLCTLGILVLAAVAGRRGADWADRVTAAAVLVTTAVIAVGMSMALPDEGTMGNYAYGRYLLPLMPVLFAAGATALVKAPVPVLGRAVLGLAAATAAALGIVWLYAGDALATRSYSTYDFPEMAFLSGEWDGLPMWPATWTALLVFGLLVAARIAFARRGTVAVCAGGLCVLSIVMTAVVDRKITEPWNGRLAEATSLHTVGLTAQDRVAMVYPGMPWRIWTSHAFQARNGLTPFDPGYAGPPAPGISLIIIPWDQKSDPRGTWPARSPGWYLAAVKPSYLGGWVAWRPGTAGAPAR